MSDRTVVPSLFRFLRDRFGNDLVPTTMTKAALVDLSHLIEDVVLNDALPALILTGFQESSYWQQESARYRQMAGVVNTILVFAGGDLPPEKGNNIFVRLEPDDQMRQEWFLLVLTNQFSCLLCGLDKLEPVPLEAERAFETYLTFDPAQIEIAVDVLETALAERNPQKLGQLQTERARFKPVLPSPYYFNLFISRFTDHLYRYQKVSRELGKERAVRETIAGILHNTSQPLTAALLTLQLVNAGEQITVEDMELLESSLNELKARLDNLREVVGSKKMLSTNASNSAVEVWIVPEPPDQNN